MTSKPTKFVICLDNSDFPASLEKRKIYECIEDADAASVGQVRVVDESGEDYLYPQKLFIDANLPDATRSAIINAA